MERKAVFFDVDGTLLDQGGVADSAAEAVRRIREKGHLAFVCTGRSRVSVPETPVLDIGFDGIVAACGIYGEYKGEVLFHYPLRQEQTAAMIDALRSVNAMYVLEGSENIYYDEQTIRGHEDNYYLAYIKKNIPERFVPVQRAGRIDADKASIHMEQGIPEEICALFGKEYEVLRHNASVAELVPKGFSKAKGIALMCRQLRIAREDTIAVGDSVNDADMLRYAGVGICMGNGTDAAKACADYITTDIQKDGIYRAMAHFGLL